MVLVFYFTWAIVGAAAACAGGLVVDPVEPGFREFDTISRMYTLLPLLLEKSPLFSFSPRFCVVVRADVKASQSGFRALWIRRQTGRLSGWIYGSDKIMVALRWGDCFGWREAWGWFVIDLRGELVIEGFGKFYYGLMVGRNVVFLLLDFRRQRDRFVEATTTPLRMKLVLVEYEKYNKSAFLSSE